MVRAKRGRARGKSKNKKKPAKQTTKRFTAQKTNGGQEKNTLFGPNGQVPDGVSPQQRYLFLNLGGPPTVCLGFGVEKKKLNPAEEKKKSVGKAKLKDEGLLLLQKDSKKKKKKRKKGA